MLMKKKAKEERPDAVILIDYPGFNFRIAEFAKKNWGSGEECHFPELTELSKTWDTCLLTRSQAPLLPYRPGLSRELRETQMGKSAGDAGPCQPG